MAQVALNLALVLLMDVHRVLLEFCLFWVLVSNIFNEEYRSTWWVGSINAARKIIKHTVHEDYRYLLFSVLFFLIKFITWIVLKFLENGIKSIEINPTLGITR